MKSSFDSKQEEECQSPQYTVSTVVLLCTSLSFWSSVHDSETRSIDDPLPINISIHVHLYVSTMQRHIQLPSTFNINTTIV
jgi:hypothetical protein